MANAVLSPEVRAVLERSTIQSNSVKLPHQMERKLYEAVNKALANAGGKWNRSAQAHLFAGDPRPKLGLMLETGVSVDEKKLRQEFYTPPDLAHNIAATARVRGCSVLEPSAGHGALADACMTQGASRVTCVEVNPESCKVLNGKGYAVCLSSFLTVQPRKEDHYERIVMNPPFTRGQDLIHIEHALNFLADDGLLVCVILGNKKVSDWDFVPSQFSVQVNPLPAKSFKESGTIVATAVVKIGRKQ